MLQRMSYHLSNLQEYYESTQSVKCASEPVNFTKDVLIVEHSL